MASTLKIPPNNLGIYLTKKIKLNIDIYAKTGISTVELSKLRSGLIKTLDAKKLYLILKAEELKLNDALKQIYPNLSLVSEVKADSTFRNLFDFFDAVEANTLTKISLKTGIPLARLKNIKNNQVNPAAHELYLIELATKTKPGTLFTILFEDLELNSPDEEARLRMLEKQRSSKKLL